MPYTAATVPLMNGEFPSQDFTGLPPVFDPANTWDPRANHDRLDDENADDEDSRRTQEYNAKILKKAQLRYVLKARPKDKRYAQRVHGASLATQWKHVWTDDTTISTDARLNEATKSIDQALSAHIANSVSDELMSIEGRTGMPLSANEVAYVRNRALNVIPSDSLLSRLSNLVLSLEEIAVGQMRNVADAQIRRRTHNYHKFYSVQSQLDLAAYKHDIGILCRSLRRDDLMFPYFAQLVGALLCEAFFIKGTHAVNYLQMRIQRTRVARAVAEAVAFLGDMPRRIKVDTLGQADGAFMYSLHGQWIVLHDTGHGPMAYSVPPNLPLGVQIKFEPPDDEPESSYYGSSSNGSGSDDDGPVKTSTADKVEQRWAMWQEALGNEYAGVADNAGLYHHNHTASQPATLLPHNQLNPVVALQSGSGSGSGIKKRKKHASSSSSPPQGIHKQNKKKNTLASSIAQTPVRF